MYSNESGILPNLQGLQTFVHHSSRFFFPPSTNPPPLFGQRRLTHYYSNVVIFTSLLLHRMLQTLRVHTTSSRHARTVPRRRMFSFFILRGKNPSAVYVYVYKKLSFLLSSEPVFCRREHRSRLTFNGEFFLLYFLIEFSQRFSVYDAT